MNVHPIEDAEPGRSAAVEHVAALLRQDGEPDTVHRWLHALSDQELTSFGLNAYRMNLLSLFGRRWPHERLQQAAREAAISKLWLGWEYHHHYLPGLGAQPARRQLDNLPLQEVRELLARGRGLIIASFHQGHMRHIPSDLAHEGVSVCVPLAADSFNDYFTAQQSNPDAALWRDFRYVNVEERGGSLALARVLAKGGCVLSTLDGNTGQDGPRGGARRVEVRMLDSTVRVKDGLIALAARFGSPVLPLIAHTVDGRRTCHAGAVIDPGKALMGEASERFIADAAQRLYAFLADDLVEHAGEWCGGDLFHQWRVPDRPTLHCAEEIRQSLQRDLEAGNRIEVNHGRIVELSRGGDIVWADALTQRCYRLPGSMGELGERLSAGHGGVDLGWLESRSDIDRTRIWEVVCQLASRDVLRAHGGNS